MFNFKELSDDGQGLELLVREILFNKGFRVYWSGKGADGGRDLLCHEERDSLFIKDSKIWLIQCKHNAVSGKSVGLSDLDDIVDSCSHHNAEGYLLVCSTYPSSKVVERLEGISNNHKNNISATYWDAVKLEQLLTTPELWRVAQNFFPKSANATGWQVYATEKPNHWVAIYKGYYFHLSNRIGSTLGHHFKSIEDRIAEIEGIELPKKHFIRIRSIHYDDKNGNYSFYLDYMYPHDEEPIGCREDFLQLLGDGYALDDGQIYHFDILAQSYFEHSDHYDPDHYDYYVPFLAQFYWGQERKPDYRASSNKLYDWYFNDLEDENEALREKGFDELVKVLSGISGIRLMRAVNSNIESGRRRDYSRRPPTPPCVRFRTRRFTLNTESG